MNCISLVKGLRLGFIGSYPILNNYPVLPPYSDIRVTQTTFQKIKLLVAPVSWYKLLSHSLGNSHSQKAFGISHLILENANIILKYRLIVAKKLNYIGQNYLSCYFFFILLCIFPGIDAWPGKQMHSHNYRIPDPFRDLVVILRGVGSSALDISMNIAQVAKEVHIASRSTKVGVLGNMFGYDNLRLHPMVKIESIH